VSSENGAGIWTIEELLAATEKAIALPGLSEAIGRPASLHVRKISMPEHRTCLPGLPPEAETWDEKEWLARQVSWLTSLTEEQIESRRMAHAMTAYRIVALASVSPKLTLEQAQRLGQEAVSVAVEILQFSGLARVEEVAPVPELAAA
jgi:hypothetical protein